MNEELKKALRKVIDYLDEKMAASPDQELANTSNYLENIAQENGA